MSSSRSAIGLNPTYEQICAHNTGHAEVAEIEWGRGFASIQHQDGKRSDLIVIVTSKEPKRSDVTKALSGGTRPPGVYASSAV